jgi:KTSC domain
MANPGVPQGGSYPSKQEIEAQLGSILEGDVTSLRVDRRKLYGKQAGRIYNDVLNAKDIDTGYMGAGVYYEGNNPRDYKNYNPATDEQIEAAGGNQSAFVEWDVPTSSTQYQRPRTVAAGYDANRQTMTVVFRDGTFYNYYEVSAGEWESFHASYSKGRPWLNKKNKNQAQDGLFVNKPRGNAGDMEDVDPKIREALYRVARTQQQKIRPKVGRTSQKPGYAVPGGGMASIPNRAGRSPSAYKRSGVVQGRNPAIANKQNKSALRRKAS